MKKHLLFLLRPLIAITFLLTGCEKEESPVTQKIEVREKGEVVEIVSEAEEGEIIGGKERSVISKDPPATDHTKFEGSESLKRYLGD